MARTKKRKNQMQRNIAARSELEEIAGRTRYYREIMGLTDWNVTIQVVAHPEIPDAHADVEYDTDERSAVIRLAWPIVSDLGMDWLLCHELAHLWLCGEEDEERVCNAWASSLTRKDCLD